MANLSLTVKKKRRKNFTKSFAAAPEHGVMFAALSMEEMREAQHTGRIPNKDLYLSPYPHFAAEDARLGLMTDRETPKPNAPAFVVGIKMPTGIGLHPVPHGVPMFTTNAAIPFSDVKEVHEVHPNTQSGFNQFLRMGGVAKAWQAPKPGAMPKTPPNPSTPSPIGEPDSAAHVQSMFNEGRQYNTIPAHMQTQNELRRTQKTLYHSGVSGTPGQPMENDRVMHTFAMNRPDAQQHRDLNSWSQAIDNRGNLEYSRPTIEKLLNDNSGYALYSTSATHPNPYRTPSSPVLYSAKDFNEQYPAIENEVGKKDKLLEEMTELQNLGQYKKIPDAVQKYQQEGRVWNLTKYPDAPQGHHVYGPSADLRQRAIWNNTILPYIGKHGKTEYDRALLEHAANNLAHQDTYGSTPGVMGIAGTQDGRLRRDHAMWHFADRSPALRDWLHDNGYTSATIPNYLTDNDGKNGEPNPLTLVANNDATRPLPPGDGYGSNNDAEHVEQVHKKLIGNAVDEGRSIPPDVWNEHPEMHAEWTQRGANIEPPDAWENPLSPINDRRPPAIPDPYDEHPSPLSHFKKPIQAVQRKVYQRMQDIGVNAVPNKSGFLSLDPNWKKNPKMAEPHVMTETAKNIVATAFGVDPDIFNRVSFKLPNYAVTSSLDGAYGYQTHEGVSVMQGVSSLARDPNRVPMAYATIVHEMIHALQENANGVTAKEQDGRFRSFGWTQKRRNEKAGDRETMEAHTDLMAHVMNTAAFGEDGHYHYGNITYQTYVFPLIHQLMERSDMNPAEALNMLKEGTIHPDHPDIPRVQEITKDPPMMQKLQYEQFVGQMTDIARGVDPRETKRGIQMAREYQHSPSRMNNAINHGHTR